MYLGCILTDSERLRDESHVGGCRAVCQCSGESRKKGKCVRACVRVRVRESQDESSLFASLSDCLALKTTVGGDELIHLLPLTESNSLFLLHFHSLCLPVMLKNNQNVITHFLMCGPHSH